MKQNQICKMKKIVFLVLIFISSNFYAQENNILERLSALKNNGRIWYNIDGYSATSEIFKNSFDEKGLQKVFRKHKISDSDTKIKDPQINFNNLFVTKKTENFGE